jgi:hypothetical protein
MVRDQGPTNFPQAMSYEHTSRGHSRQRQTASVPSPVPGEAQLPTTNHLFEMSVDQFDLNRLLWLIH